MSDEVLRTIGWMGLAVGIIAAFMVLEVLLRTLFTRYGTQQGVMTADQARIIK